MTDPKKQAVESFRMELAAFGKHPGWNDHIDDIGLTTEALVRAKQQLYHEGLSSQIDAGAWEKLEPEARLEGFDHVLIWRQRDRTLIGRMVSSSDGKGRTRYPMVLCAEVPANGWTSRLAGVLARLDETVVACRETTDPEAVIAEVQAARAQLGAMSASTPPPTAVSLRLPERGLDDEALARVLYQLRNQFSTWAPGRYQPAEAAERSGTLRLPLPSEDEQVSLVAWAGFLADQFDAAAPLLLIHSRAGSWIDVVVGAPQAADFFCLRAGLKAIPPSHEIPFEIDEAFRAEIAPQMEALLAPGAPVPSVFGAAPAAGAAFSGRSVVQGALATVRRPGNRKLLLIAAGVVVALIGLVALILGLRGDGEEKVHAPAAATLPEPTTDWGRLCLGYYDWFGVLKDRVLEAERRSLWSTEPELKLAVDALDQVQREVGSLDPRVIAGINGGALLNLIELPPSSVADPATGAAISRAATAMRDLQKAILACVGPDAWTPVVASLQRAGAETAAAAVTAAVGAPLEFDAAMATTVDQRLRLRASLAASLRALDSIQAAEAALAASDDPWLQQSVDMIHRSAVSVALADLPTWVAGVRPPLLAAARLMAGDVAGGKFDLQRFAKERSSPVPPPSDVSGRLTWWTQEIEQFRRVDVATLVWSSGDWRAALPELAALEAPLREVGAGALAESTDRRVRSTIAEIDQRVQGQVVTKDVVPLRDWVAERTQAIAEAIDQARRELVSRTDPAAWKNALTRTSYASWPLIDQAWAQQRSAWFQAVDSAGDDISIRLRIRTRAAAWQGFFDGLIKDPVWTAEPTSPAGPTATVADWIAQPVDAYLRGERDRLVKVILAGIPRGVDAEAPRWSEAVTAPAVARGLQGYRESSSRLRGLMQGLGPLAAQLTAGAVWNDARQAEYRAVVADLNAVDPAPGTPLAQWRARWESLESLVGLTDAGAILKRLEQAPVSELRTGWERLRQLENWPSTAAGVRQSLELGQHVQAAAQAANLDATRMETIREEVQVGLKLFWNRGFEHAPTAEMVAILNLAKPCGLTDAIMTPAQRAAVFVLGLKDIAWARLSAAEVEQRHAAIIKQLDGFSGQGVAFTGKLAATLQAIDLKEKAVDFTTLGPGAVGWELETPLDPSQPVYRWKAGDDTVYRLAFVMVQPGDAAPVYLAKEELPVGLALAWAKEKNLWAAWQGASALTFEEMSGATGDNRSGPRTFVVRKGAAGGGVVLVLAPDWLTGVNKDHYAPPPPAAPSARSPLNYVSPRAAVLLSTALGGRLPTAGEWNAGMAHASEPANLRDQTWWAQKEHVAGTKTLRWPDADMFPYSEVQPRPGVGADATINQNAATDGWLWFAPVDARDGETFAHLIGNVAEFVTTADGRAAVIGTSALSPPGLEMNTPYAVDQLDDLAGRGFSDVGVRLAFGLSVVSPGIKIQRLLNDAVLRDP